MNPNSVGIIGPGFLNQVPTLSGFKLSLEDLQLAGNWFGVSGFRGVGLKVHS